MLCIHVWLDREEREDSGPCAQDSPGLAGSGTDARSPFNPRLAAHFAHPSFARALCSLPFTLLSSLSFLLPPSSFLSSASLAHSPCLSSDRYSLPIPALPFPDSLITRSRHETTPHGPLHTASLKTRACTLSLTPRLSAFSTRRPRSLHTSVFTSRLCSGSTISAVCISTSSSKNGNEALCRRRELYKQPPKPVLFS